MALYILEFKNIPMCGSIKLEISERFDVLPCTVVRSSQLVHAKIGISTVVDLNGTIVEAKISNWDICMFVF